VGGLIPPGKESRRYKGSNPPMNYQANERLPRKPRRSEIGAVAPDRVGAVAKARRHSRFVKAMRIALPIGAVAVLGLYFTSSNLTISLGNMEASVGDIEINRDSLRMINPKLEGVTDKNGAYVLTADYAEQDTSDLTTLYLHKVSAELTQSEDGWSRLTAPKGTFRTKKEELELLGGIDVTSSSGASARVERAIIDMKAQRISSKDPVEVETADGTLTADRLEISAAEKRILFHGNVRLHIVKVPKSKKNEGRIEAEAQ
jgi:lipopolysaccharide export system protein LptC